MTYDDRPMRKRICPICREHVEGGLWRRYGCDVERVEHPEELIVDAALVTDSLGRPIDGMDDGQPGGDYITTLSGSRVTEGGVPLVRTHGRPAAAVAPIDALLAGGQLADLRRPSRLKVEIGAPRN
jgi:hypothetical protein